MSSEDSEMVEVELIVNEKTIEGGDIYDIIEPTRWIVDIYQNEETYNFGLKKFTESQKYVFAIYWYKYEVDNGGHSQFFFNSTGIVWKDALKGFETLGLHENVEILKSAATKLGGQVYLDRRLRNEQLENSSADFDSEDNRFYEIDEKVGIENTLLEFIRKNKSDFYFRGQVVKPRGY